MVEKDGSGQFFVLSDHEDQLLHSDHDLIKNHEKSD